MMIKKETNTLPDLVVSAIGELNENIQQAENIFLSIPTLINCRVEIHAGGDLLLAKSGRKWGLLYQRERGDPQPLLLAPLQARIASAYGLNKLMSQLADRLVTRKERVVDAAEEVAAFILTQEGRQ